METGTVTTKGQIVIPARTRRRFGIRAGTRIRFFERDGEIVLQPVTGAAVRSLCGILKSQTSATADLLTGRTRDREHEEAVLENRGSR